MAEQSAEQADRYRTYQWLLRALGAYLDEQPSCRISLAEVSDGFIVRLQRALHKMEPQVLQFKHETLKEQLDQLFQAHRSTQIKIRHQGIWGSIPNGHQDFFRALGFELDEAKAHNVLIDELENGLVLTYSYQDADDGNKWKKKMIMLDLDAMEEILNEAFKRRGKR